MASGRLSVIRWAMIAVVVGAGIGAAFAVTSSSGSAQPHVVRPALARIQPCSGAPTVRPRSYVISCADANTELVGMHWRRWTGRTAVGSGSFVRNLCVPNCAAGRYVRSSATVSLNRPLAVGRQRLFSEMAVRFRSGHRSALVRYALPEHPFGTH